MRIFKLNTEKYREAIYRAPAEKQAINPVLSTRQDDWFAHGLILDH